ncbi:MAG TPA: PilZ domain-containing protein [Candidatus Aminicenantes bacterium]|nr:PilZ domain-containing protein [Candidatus Aminicenantes bacterium]
MAIKYAGQEKRKFPRIENPFFISYRLEDDNSFGISKAIGENISGGGLMFEKENSFHSCSILYLEIYLQSDPTEDTIYSTPTKAKVVWVNRKENVSKEPGSNKYQVGIEFIEIKTEDRERIIEYAERAKR